VAHSTLAGALLFLVCGVVGAQRNSAGDSLKRAAPLPRPQLTALLFFLSGVAVAGMPPLSGFVGKTMLLQATSGMLAAPWVWTLILLTSFLSILVLARAGLLVFWSVRTREPAGQPNAAAGFAAPMLLLALVGALALAAEPVKRFTDATAAQLADTASYIELVLTMEGRP
jgi:multicomponent K+:H+ antiporter subunit D